jgi:hypothetical protein
MDASQDDEPQVYCYSCGEWWAITIEFWRCRTQFDRCRACDDERARLYQAQRAFDPDHRLRQVEKSRRYRAYLKGIAPELYEAYRRDIEERALARQQARREAARRSGISEAEQKVKERRDRNREHMRSYRLRQKAAA